VSSRAVMCLLSLLSCAEQPQNLGRWARWNAWLRGFLIILCLVFFSGGYERTALQIGGRWVRFGPQIIFGPWIIFDHTAPGARGLARRGFAKAALRDVP
jgi:hypothetical protein